MMNETLFKETVHTGCLQYQGSKYAHGGENTRHGMEEDTQLEDGIRCTWKLDARLARDTIEPMAAFLAERYQGKAKINAHAREISLYIKQPEAKAMGTMIDHDFAQQLAQGI